MEKAPQASIDRFPSTSGKVSLLRASGGGLPQVFASGDRFHAWRASLLKIYTDASILGGMSMAIAGNLLTTADVAKLLGVSDIRVRQFYRRGRLAGQRVGMQLFFERKIAEKFAKQARNPGRPKKSRKGR